MKHWRKSRQLLAGQPCIETVYNSALPGSPSDRLLIIAGKLGFIYSCNNDSFVVVARGAAKKHVVAMALANDAVVNPGSRLCELKFTFNPALLQSVMKIIRVPSTKGRQLKYAEAF